MYPVFVAIIGPMGTAKTLKLMEMVHKRAQGGFKCLALKHQHDIRYTTEPMIVSHNQATLKSDTNIKVDFYNTQTILGWLEKKEKFDQYDVIAMDEAHFLTIGCKEDYEILGRLAQYIVATLKKTFVFTAIDRWFTGTPVRMVFQAIHMVQPDKIHTCRGICKLCQNEHGIYTMRTGTLPPIQKEEDHVWVGGFETYLTVCRVCFNQSSQ